MIETRRPVASSKACADRQTRYIVSGQTFHRSARSQTFVLVMNSRSGTNSPAGDRQPARTDLALVDVEQINQRNVLDGAGTKSRCQTAEY